MRGFSDSTLSHIRWSDSNDTIPQWVHNFYALYSFEWRSIPNFKRYDIYCTKCNKPVATDIGFNKYVMPESVVEVNLTKYFSHICAR